MSDVYDDPARWLTVAILLMPNPPSWNEASRIADYLVAQGIVLIRRDELETNRGDH